MNVMFNFSHVAPFAQYSHINRLLQTDIYLCNQTNMGRFIVICIERDISNRKFAVVCYFSIPIFLENLKQLIRIDPRSAIRENHTYATI